VVFRRRYLHRLDYRIIEMIIGILCLGFIVSVVVAAVLMSYEHEEEEDINDENFD